MAGRACISGFLELDWNLDPARAEAERLGIPLSNFQSGTIDDAGWRGTFQDIVDRVQDGRYRDILDRTFPLAEIADAHRYMEENRAAGKVVGLLTGARRSAPPRRRRRPSRPAGSRPRGRSPRRSPRR